MNKILRDMLIELLPWIGLGVFFIPLILSIAFSWWFALLFLVSWKPTLEISKLRYKLKMQRKRDKTNSQT